MHEKFQRRAGRWRAQGSQRAPQRRIYAGCNRTCLDEAGSEEGKEESEVQESEEEGS